MLRLPQGLARLVGDVLRVALSLLALVVLFRQVGGQGVIEVLRQANWLVLAGAWALFLAGIVIRVFRWRALLHGLGLRPPFVLLLKLYLVGGFFNSFLPSGFGGDVVRVLELGRDAENSAAALGTVVVDRLTGILSLLALGLVVLPFAQGLPSWLVWLFVVVAGGGSVAGTLLLEGRLLRSLALHLPTRLVKVGRGKLASVYAAVTGSGPQAVWQALGYSTLFNLSNVCVHWLCARAVGIQLGLSFYFVVVPLLSLALLVPISVGGLGARDWVAQILLGPTTVPESTTAAWTLSVWVVSAAAGLVGGVIYLWEGVSGLVSRPDGVGGESGPRRT